MNTRRENGPLAAIFFGGVLVVAVFAWWMSLAPAPLPADAPADQFSAFKAVGHVRKTALEPHPTGSPANEKVYVYIEEQLKALDVEYQVLRPIMRDGHMVNRGGAILARISGTASTGAFAVDAHIDSTPYGPGAADDLSGCAAMLETIRALKAGAPLRNDIIFCFSDGEEGGGGAGAEVFMNHECFEDVRVLLGLEARGCSGPALMNDTGPDNGFLIRQMAKSDARPRASSFMHELCKRVAFGYNMRKYVRNGVSGLNVAYIDDFCYYHTRLDTPENVSLASLQHHGQYTLGLARQLGNVSLENVTAPDATYFNTLASWMVIYPRSWGGPMAAVVLLLLVLVLGFGLVKKRLSVWQMLAGPGVYLLSMLLALLVTVPLAYLTFIQFREHALYRNNSIALSFVLVGAGMYVLMTRLLGNRVRPQNLLAGTLLVWAAFLVVLQTMFPGGAYVTLWPLLFSTAGLVVLLLSCGPGHPAERVVFFSGLFALPGIILLVPGLVMFSYALTALAVPALLFLVLLVVSLLLPQMTLISLRRQTSVGLGLLALGGIVYGYAFLSNTPSPERPRQNFLSYAVNFDTGEAWWISGDQKTDEWTRQFFPEGTPRVSIKDITGKEDRHTYLRSRAPAPPFGKTILEKRGDSIKDGHRMLTLFVDSPRHARRIELALESHVEVYRAKALGVEMEGGAKKWRLVLQIMPCEGGEIELELEPDKPVKFSVREVSFSLPEWDALPPRPDWMMTETNRVLDRSKSLNSNHTYSSVTYEF